MMHFTQKDCRKAIKHDQPDVPPCIYKHIYLIRCKNKSKTTQVLKKQFVKRHLIDRHKVINLHEIQNNLQI